MIYRLTLLFVTIVLLAGCGGPKRGYDVSGPVIAEGPIWHARYDFGAGEIRAFTRSQHSLMLPSDGGELKVDAYGVLTPEFLIITYPQRKDMGPRIVPADRLLELQFGTGGVDSTGLN